MDHKGQAQLEKAKKVVTVLYRASPRILTSPTRLAMLTRSSPRFRSSVALAAGVTPLSDETVDLVVDLAEWAATLPQVDSSRMVPE